MSPDKNGRVKTGENNFMQTSSLDAFITTIPHATADDILTLRRIFEAGVPDIPAALADLAARMSARAAAPAVVDEMTLAMELASVPAHPVFTTWIG